MPQSPHSPKIELGEVLEVYEVLEVGHSDVHYHDLGPVRGLMDFMQARLRTSLNANFHFMLNNHASQRPKELGGPLCPSIRGAMAREEVEEQIGPNTANRCRVALVLENSFHPDDGLKVVVLAQGETEEIGGHTACAAMIATLLLRGPDLVRLLPHFFTCPVVDIVNQAKHLAMLDGQVEVPLDQSRLIEDHPAYGHPLLHRAAPKKFTYEPPGDGPGCAEIREEEVLAVLRKAIQLERSGWVTPHAPKRGLHKQLGKLLKRHGLRTFLKAHSEFVIREEGDSWSFGFAPWPDRTNHGQCDEDPAPPPAPAGQPPPGLPKASPPPLPSQSFPPAVSLRWL